MPLCVAFLRAVNVGGRVVRMEALRAAFEALGLVSVQTFIASGNVIFSTRARDLHALERRIEAHLHSHFGFEIHTFVRDHATLMALIAHPAFDEREAAAARTHVVGFLASTPDAAARQTLGAFDSAADRFHLNERELYWLSSRAQSESVFSNAAFERATKMRATFRNMSTLRKLAEKLGAA